MNYYLDQISEKGFKDFLKPLSVYFDISLI